MVFNLMQFVSKHLRKATAICVMIFGKLPWELDQELMFHNPWRGWNRVCHEMYDSSWYVSNATMKFACFTSLSSVNRFIFLSVTATLLMWALMLPTYFTIFYAYLRATILAFCLLFNVFLTLTCQYGPKMYAALFVREENIIFGTMANTTQVTAIT